MASTIPPSSSELWTDVQRMAPRTGEGIKQESSRYTLGEKFANFRASVAAWFSSLRMPSFNLFGRSSLNERRVDFIPPPMEKFPPPAPLFPKELKKGIKIKIPEHFDKFPIMHPNSKYISTDSLGHEKWEVNGEIRVNLHPGMGKGFWINPKPI